MVVVEEEREEEEEIEEVVVSMAAGLIMSVPVEIFSDETSLTNWVGEYIPEVAFLLIRPMVLAEDSSCTLATKVNVESRSP